jgi:RNA-binding protein
MPPLSPAARRALRARAHPLQPVVIVGAKGLTDAVLKEADAALTSHELIKIKLASDDREERATQILNLTAALAASPVQQIGKIAILYREKVETPSVPGPTRPAPNAKRRSTSSRARPPSRPPTAAVKRIRGPTVKAPGARSPRRPAKPRAVR